MNAKMSNDDILFDRLVDGELSARERQTLLQSLESRKDGWRKCALAFLEAQSWRESSHGIITNIAQPSGLTPLLQASGSTATPSNNDAKISRAPTDHPKRISIKLLAEWFAIAAAVVVAFRVGALQHGPGNLGTGGAGPVQKQLAGVLPAIPGASAATKPSDALNLWVKDDTGNFRRVRVPLVNASDLDPNLGVQFETGVPADVRNRLQNEGYAVQSKRKFAPMWLDNGRQMVVPVEDTKIVPVSNKVY